MIPPAMSKTVSFPNGGLEELLDGDCAAQCQLERGNRVALFHSPVALLPFTPCLWLAATVAKLLKYLCLSLPACRMGL